MADSGAGFEAAEGDRLFERFFRSDAPEVQAERGHGLGLAVAERHGGRGTAASAGPGAGSAFAIRLPLSG